MGFFDMKETQSCRASCRKEGVKMDFGVAPSRVGYARRPPIIGPLYNQPGGWRPGIWYACMGYISRHLPTVATNPGVPPSCYGVRPDYSSSVRDHTTQHRISLRAVTSHKTPRPTHTTARSVKP